MEERLQKFMARCGVASRRKCEEIIKNGLVEVNGVKVTELGVKIDSNKDKVSYDGNYIYPEENKVYIMLNKPRGIITSLKDEKDRKTILDIVKIQERVYPIGRLDYDSEGLLLLTNDGEIYNKIIHPRVELNKVYIAKCKGTFSKNDIEKFKNGIDIGGYVTAPAEIEIMDDRNNESLVRVTIHEGKNRQIRKMCQGLNHDVLSLKRVSIGKLELGYLKTGEYRMLTKEEINYIKSL